jgi:signal transduction histidine kinase
LEQAGIRAVVDEFGTGGDVIAHYRSAPADCVLLDYFLPGETGVAVLEELKALDKYAPVVMITGNGSEDVAVAALKAGAQDYMTKINISAETVSRIIWNCTERVAMLRKIDAQREALESFARVLAHDLGSPLTALHGSATLLEREISRAPRNPEKIARFAEAIASSAQRMGALVTTLTEYVSVEGSVELGPASMQQVFGDALANLEVMIAERGAAVTHDMLPDVNGNPVLLTQLLQNLIANGIKYCKAAPVIRVGAVASGGDGWLFSVKDNGIGIPQEHLQSVFQPFKRLHRNGGYGGTGLGLTTCKRIIERHQGRIWCESKEGSGTTFFFTLPMSGAE